MTREADVVRGRSDGSRRFEAPEPRRWTQAATVGAGAHVFYELAAGVGMPFASRVGPVPAAVFHAACTLTAFREASRQPRSRDAAFAVLDGALLSAVVAHFAGWPRRYVAGVPWLTDCEGLEGAAIHPYNVILYISGVAAIGGMVENRRGRRLGVLMPAVLVPWVIREQRRELSRLRAEARRHPGWWNRRL